MAKSKTESTIPAQVEKKSEFIDPEDKVGISITQVFYFLIGLSGLFCTASVFIISNLYEVKSRLVVADSSFAQTNRKLEQFSNSLEKYQDLDSDVKYLKQSNSELRSNVFTNNPTSREKISNK